MFGTNLTACTQALKRVFASGLQEFADFTNNGLTFSEKGTFLTYFANGIGRFVYFAKICLLEGVVLVNFTKFIPVSYKNKKQL